MATTPATPKKPTNNKAAERGCLVIILLILAIILIVAVTDRKVGTGGSGGNGGSGSDKSFAAKFECNEFVKDRLKSPSTAHFGEDTPLNTDSNEWVVSGSVDSENSFGAALRSTFTCTMTVTGDNWHLDHLDFNDGGN